MSNSFGPSSSQQYPLVDPRCVREDRDRFRRDAFPELERANSYYSMGGRWPDVGWLLLDRASYASFNVYGTSFELHMQDYVDPEVVVRNLAIVQARCVTRGLPSDTGAVYLIQVTNTEGVLYNPWFQFPTNSQYNVRVPAYPDKFYDWSLNQAAGGTTWTWDTMVGDLWAQAPAELGAYPHLPITPAGTPEGWVFVGEPLWEAINRVMDYLGFAISGNLPSLTIVVPGAADAAFTALQAKYGPPEDDMEYLDGGSGRVPVQVVVYGHRRNAVYGTEETVRYDGLNWQAASAYSVTVAAPATFSRAQGTAYIWVSQTVRYDHDGNPLAADVAAFNAVAQERATQYFNTIFRGTQGFMRQVYGGALPFVTGSLVDGVRWYNTGLDYGRPEWAGWRTEIIRGYIWEEATFPLTLQGLTGPT